MLDAVGGDVRGEAMAEPPQGSLDTSVKSNSTEEFVKQVPQLSSPVKSPSTGVSIEVKFDSTSVKEVEELLPSTSLHGGPGSFFITDFNQMSSEEKEELERVLSLLYEKNRELSEKLLDLEKNRIPQERPRD